MCDYSCVGCTDFQACNYDINSSIDNGLCEYDSCVSCSDNENKIILYAQDTYGDGWNNNLLNIYFYNNLYDPNELGYTYTLDDGFEETITFCIDNDILDCMYIEVNGGS